jgi:hypothetical protein
MSEFHNFSLLVLQIGQESLAISSESLQSAKLDCATDAIFLTQKERVSSVTHVLVFIGFASLSECALPKRLP